MWRFLRSVANFTRQLDKYRSVCGQFSVSALKQENQELRKCNGMYKSIIEEYGLEHLLGKKKPASGTRCALSRFRGEYSPRGTSLLSMSHVVTQHSRICHRKCRYRKRKLGFLKTYLVLH